MSTIIDCHTHIGINAHNLRRGIYPFEQTMDTLLHKMDAHGITKSIVLPFPYSSLLPEMDRPSYREPRRSSFTKLYQKDNFALIHAANQHRDRVNPFPNLNPRDKACLEHMQHPDMLEILGVKLHPVAFDYPIRLLLNHPLTKKIQDLDLVVVLHVGTGKEGGKRGVTLAEAIELAKAYQSIRFIFCHLGRLHKDLPKVLELENVRLDTSGLSLNSSSKAFMAKTPFLGLAECEPRYVIRHLVDLGYEEKIVWGSDEPYTNYDEELDYIVHALISESVKQKILSGNIMRFLK